MLLWFFIYSQSCAIITTVNFRIFLPSMKGNVLLAVNLYFSPGTLPLALDNHSSTLNLYIFACFGHLVQLKSCVLETKHKGVFLVIKIYCSQSLSHVQLFATPWTAAHQASLFFTISLSLLKLRSTE